MRLKPVCPGSVQLSAFKAWWSVVALADQALRRHAIDRQALAVQEAVLGRRAFGQY